MIESERDLTSWKEIAAHLSVSVRTAQMWERERGLPVRRLPGPRGRVVASIPELEAWKRSRNVRLQGGIQEDARSDPPSREALASGAGVTSRETRSQWLLPAFVFAGLAALAGAVMGITAIRPSPSPAAYRVVQDALIVLDDQGRELWRKTVPGLQPPVYEKWRLVWIGDLDGDGAAEVLFAPVQGSGPYKLVCYDARGTEQWRFAPGRTVRTADRSYPGPHGVQGFAVTKPDGHGRRRVVLLSAGTYFPSQAVLLSHEGKVLREYWHSGHLRHVQIADLDRDGLEEFYLAGINNAAKSATLVALDPEHFGGAAAERDPHYALLGMPDAQERARILFPRTCMNRAGEPFNAVTGMALVGGDLQVAVVERMLDPQNPSILYQFTPSLRLRDVGTSSAYDTTHARLRAAGELDHDLSPREVEALRPMVVAPFMQAAGPTVASSPQRLKGSD